MKYILIALMMLIMSGCNNEVDYRPMNRSYESYKLLGINCKPESFEHLIKKENSTYYYMLRCDER